MLWRGDAERRVWAQRLVVHEGCKISFVQRTAQCFFESLRPVIGGLLMAPPSIGMKIMHNVSGAQEEDPRGTERAKRLASSEMLLGRERFVQAQLNYRNIGFRVHSV